MTARLDLLAHGASAATRAARFPDDEALEASAVGALEALRGRLRPYAHVLTAPARAARETAQALGFDAEVEMALRDCDYGRWRGLASKEVAEREPDGFAAWLGDPAAAPAWRRVGRSSDRADPRLARAIAGARKRDAGRHPRRGRSSGDRERARRRFLGLRADRRRAALARQTQRSCRTLESCGVRAIWGPVVRGAWSPSLRPSSCSLHRPAKRVGSPRAAGRLRQASPYPVSRMARWR